MSFEVVLTKIKAIKEASESNNLALAYVEADDYQYIIVKNSYVVGDTVLRIPLDAIVPNELLEKVGLLGKLDGKEKNRVKTRKMVKGLYYSEGLLVTPTVVLSADQIAANLTDYAATLGIIKYEPDADKEEPVKREVFKSKNKIDRIVHWIFKRVFPSGKTGNPLKSESEYDVPNVRQAPRQWSTFKDQVLVATEKLEGQHAIYVLKDGQYHTSSKKVYRGTLTQKTPWYVPYLEQLTSRWPLKRYRGLVTGLTMAYSATNNWHNMWRLDPTIQQTLDNLQTFFPNKMITLRGEIIGPAIQGNIYQRPKMEFWLFDVQVDGKYQDWQQLVKWKQCDVITCKVVPTVPDWSDVTWETPLAELVTKSDGTSLLHNTAREGVVLRPLTGPDKLKFRSPIYLSKEK